MRLIDADELKKKFGYTDEWYKSRTVAHEIDNAPTIEIRDNFDIGYVQGLEDGQKRPQGEWVLNGISEVGKDWYKCSICGRTIHTNENQLKEYPFCHCGAEMIKEEGDHNG